MQVILSLWPFLTLEAWEAPGGAREGWSFSPHLLTAVFVTSTPHIVGPQQMFVK